MQRMFNLDKWTRLQPGEGIEFSNPRPRNVRVDVNSPQKTALYVVDHIGEIWFLALVEGRDTIEFGTSGKFTLTCEGTEVSVFTADGDDISAVAVNPQAFAKIVERRRRNPELEQMAALMNRNMERRLEQQAAELANLFARRMEASAAQPAPPSVPASAGAEPASANGAVASDSPVTGVNTGANQDATGAAATQ